MIVDIPLNKETKPNKCVPTVEMCSLFHLQAVYKKGVSKMVKSLACFLCKGKAMLALYFNATARQSLFHKQLKRLILIIQRTEVRKTPSLTFEEKAAKEADLNYGIDTWSKDTSLPNPKKGNYFFPTMPSLKAMRVMKEVPISSPNNIQ